MPVALVWFSNDLRLDDNPALRMALEEGYTPLPVYIHAPEEEAGWAPGAASNAWRHRSLQALDADLRARGSALHLRTGPTAAALQDLLREADAQAVFWNRKYEPATQPRDAALKKQLREQGLRVESANGGLLFEPWDLATGQGTPYRVFTPFWRAARALAPAVALAGPHAPAGLRCRRPGDVVLARADAEARLGSGILGGLAAGRGGGP